MLIRSQDKMLLIPAELIRISIPYTFKTEDELYICTDYNNVEYILGIYRSKERALKVVDEIVRELHNINPADPNQYIVIYQTPELLKENI